MPDHKVKRNQGTLGIHASSFEGRHPLHYGELKYIADIVKPWLLTWKIHMGCWWYTVVSTRAFHLCGPGNSIPAQYSYQIKIPSWSHVRRVFPV